MVLLDGFSFVGKIHWIYLLTLFIIIIMDQTSYPMWLIFTKWLVIVWNWNSLHLVNCIIIFNYSPSVSYPWSFLHSFFISRQWDLLFLRKLADGLRVLFLISVENFYLTVRAFHWFLVRLLFWVMRGTLTGRSNTAVEQSHSAFFCQHMIIFRIFLVIMGNFLSD